MLLKDAQMVKGERLQEGTLEGNAKSKGELCSYLILGKSFKCFILSIICIDFSFGHIFHCVFVITKKGEIVGMLNPSTLVLHVLVMKNTVVHRSFMCYL